MGFGVQQNAFGCVTSCEHFVERAELHLGFSQPFPEKFRFSRNCDQVLNDAGVSTLLCRRRPPTVCGLVVLVVVYAVYAVFSARPAPHVGEEVLVRVPAFADRDAATSVVFEASVSRVATAIEHRPPTTVFGRFVRSLSVGAVTATASGDDLSFQTPTRFRVAAAQQVAHDDSLVPTVANTHPCRSAVGAGRAGFYRQTTEFLTYTIFETHSNLLCYSNV